MILGFDSSYTLPDDAGLRQAKADGVGAWAGYMTTKPSGIATWPKSNFDRIKAAGLGTWGYCSGWDDPAALKVQAAAWGIRILLDVENGIRGDGPWVQGFLDTSGAGLYGSPSVFAGRRAACYVVAMYPGGASPTATWLNGYTPPSGPHGWQSQGTHSAYGASVDSGYFDDWFGGAAPTPQPTHGEQMAYYMTPETHNANEPLLWLCGDLQLGPKRPVWNPAEEASYNGPTGTNMKDQTVYKVTRFVFDAMPDETEGLAAGVTAIKAAVDALTAKVATIAQGPAGAAGPPGPAVTSVTISGTYPVK